MPGLDLGNPSYPLPRGIPQRLPGPVPVLLSKGGKIACPITHPEGPRLVFWEGGSPWRKGHLRGTEETSQGEVSQGSSCDTRGVGGVGQGRVWAPQPVGLRLWVQTGERHPQPQHDGPQPAASTLNLPEPFTWAGSRKEACSGGFGSPPPPSSQDPACAHRQTRDSGPSCLGLGSGAQARLAPPARTTAAASPGPADSSRRSDSPFCLRISSSTTQTARG